MVSLDQAVSRNLLLSAMRAEDFRLISPWLACTGHKSGDSVGRFGEPIERICFPDGGIAALLARAPGGGRAAVAIIGREGMIGVGALLGQTRWSHEVVIRGADTSATFIPTDRLIDACRQSHTLHDLLLRFAGNLLLQISRTSAVNLAAPLERRLARWLLLYHDRLEGDEFPVTHEELGIMLGVRRASCTEALHVLESEGAIRSLRCRVQISDRARLEAIAAEAYGDAEADYREKIGPFGKSAGV